ncbi:zinc metallopeptidase RseP [Shewanella sp. Choline-02u-19]|uniref:sigma E protease regulator RseP n=1 Tax=unclassified Shewanella TaxID=196818 RepID=UPI000C34B969|nr:MULTISPECIES: sigma E protease regulator RseP [unclassified Shewanella]PKH54937.1 zinc metallopeptidase RseP [Shewanella sp. Bg11-22]PKI26709.1 zinc metallopeptidase RseP [Shewanella sp. Choline-02u-19]
MIDFFWNLGSFIVALGILIAAHEYGHFWVARKCGVKVERFSIGFGKAIFRRTGKDGTEYVLAMIPLGGYVKMLDERVDDVPEALKDQAFNRKNVWQRIAIVSAGPIANFIFAIIALYAMYLIGVPAIKPIIDSTIVGSPAAQIIVKEPLQVLSVGGQKVKDWEEVNLALAGHIGDKQVNISVAPLSRLEGTLSGEQTYTLDTSEWKFDPEKELPITAIGLGMYRPQILPTLALVSEDGAAGLAGIEVGDILVAVDGERYTEWTQFVNLIQQSANKSVDLTVRRDGEQLTLKVTPKSRENAAGQIEGVIGVAPTSEPWPENMKLQLEYGFIDSFPIAVDKTWQLVSVSIKMIGKLLTGDISVKNLSGPISIAQGAGNSANVGLVYFLGFLALISVNLGIINLLPLPVLDGGHLLYYFVEVITGRPVPEKVQEIGFRIGAAMLLTLMSVALFNDFSRL